jgi:hypothetical protein
VRPVQGEEGTVGWSVERDRTAQPVAVMKRRDEGGSRLIETRFVGAHIPAQATLDVEQEPGDISMDQF